MGAYAEEDVFLLLCSDGVWEFLSAQEAVDALKGYNHATGMQAAECLAKTAQAQWIKHEDGAVVDDITALIVYLYETLSLKGGSQENTYSGNTRLPVASRNTTRKSASRSSSSVEKNFNLEVSSSPKRSNNAEDGSGALRRSNTKTLEQDVVGATRRSPSRLKPNTKTLEQDVVGTMHKSPRRTRSSHNYDAEDSIGRCSF